MSDIQAVAARTTHEPGRYVVEGNGKVFLSDSAMIRGVPAVAPNPIELLVSALATCAVASVESDARDLGITFRAARAEVNSVRNPADESRFASIVVALTIEGVDKPTAEKLTTHFRELCPVYNTLRRGGPVEIDLKAIA
jgi:uncharacterized OsmC-like protein